ncbi:MAG: hypothetical protein K0S01_2678 [Herbinix sp.]|nr:hypothetical protein [Herbinix sp.]
MFQMFFSEKSIASADTNNFVIDTENVYPNMEAAYKDGYIPVVRDGKARIVLPLLFEDITMGTPDTITAAVDYGNIVGSPFVIRQYEKKVKPEVYNLPCGEAKNAFLVAFDLDLKENRINGTYLVNIVINYKTLVFNGDSLNYVNQEQEFPIYITIQDGSNPSDGSGSNPAIKLKLENCRINPQEIYPGDTFSVTGSLKNTSQNKSIKNMKINYENAEGILTPTSNSGSIYIDEILADQTGAFSFQMKAATNITNFNQKITLAIQYEDANGQQYTDTENIYITIQPKTNNTGSSGSNIFKIETGYTFAGMDNSYQKGYAPAIKLGKVNVVMPLYFKGNSEVFGDKITASIEFVNYDNQPFKIKTYTKEVKQDNCKSKEGKNLSLYLLDFSMDLDAERINGVYPVNVKVQYELNSEVKEQIFTVYVVIQDGKDPNTEEETETNPTPKVIVSAYTTEPSVCHTGDLVTFQVTLKNTNRDRNIRNIKLNYSSDTEDMIPAEDSNSIYIEEIKAGETKNITFSMKILGEVSSPNQKINLSLEGEDDKATPITDTESLYLTVELPFGLKVEKPVLTNEIESGKTQTFAFPIMNTGKTKIRNVICVLDMDGVISSGSFFIGELEPAVSTQVSLEGIVANKMITDSTISENEKYGYVSGTITVSYEDIQGNTYDQVIDLSSNITPPQNEVVEVGEISSQWWISIIIGLIVIQSIISTIIIYRKKRSI